MSLHTWTVQDDLVALYLHKFGIDNLPWTSRKSVAEACGLKPNSLKARKDNFDAIASNGEVGFANAAKLSYEVYKKYGALSESELRALAFPNLEVPK